jgi:hypothetical protein
MSTRHRERADGVAAITFHCNGTSATVRLARPRPYDIEQRVDARIVDGRGGRVGHLDRGHCVARRR